MIFITRNLSARETGSLFVRHKERRFGRGCLEKWREEQTWLASAIGGKPDGLRANAGHAQLLAGKSCLVSLISISLGCSETFYIPGIINCQGHTRRLNEWYERMTKVKVSDLPQ